MSGGGKPGNVEGRRHLPANQVHSGSRQALRNGPIMVGGRGRPHMPSGLSVRQKTLWTSICDDLERSGFLDRSDGAVIEALVVMLSRARLARSILNEEGLTHVNSQGLVARPEVAIERESFKEARLLAEQLPLSPWGRARLGLKTNQPQQSDIDDVIGENPRLRAVDGGKR